MREIVSAWGRVLVFVSLACFIVKLFFYQDELLPLIPLAAVVLLYVCFVHKPYPKWYAFGLTLIIVYGTLAGLFLGFDVLSMALPFNTLFLILGSVGTLSFSFGMACILPVSFRKRQWIVATLLFGIVFYIHDAFYSLLGFSETQLPYFYSLICVWLLGMFLLFYILTLSNTKNLQK